MIKSLFVVIMMAVSLSAQTNAATDRGIKVNGSFIEKAKIDQFLWVQYGAAVAQQFVDNELLNQEAAKLGVKADDKEINKRIALVKEQAGPDFEKKLEQSGLTLKAIESQISFSLTVEKLLKKAKGVDITDTEVQSGFEANKTSLGVPEQIRLRHILASSQQDADDLLIALKAGADFGKLAAIKSMDQTTKGKNGELGLFSKGMLVPQIESTVFTLGVNEASSVVQTTQGFHIFQVTEKVSAKPAVFKEVKERLRQALLQQKIGQVLPDYVRELRQKAVIEPNL
ncbi:MAG: peptidylprolyl isomerase [Elusimicrobiota bacterium]